MKKGLIILVRSVEVLDQAEQSCTVITGELSFDVYTGRLRFRLPFDHVPVRFYQRSMMDGVGGPKL